MTAVLAIFCLPVFAQLTPINEPFAGQTIPKTFHVSVGKGSSFARLEPRDGGHCLHLFGDHSATSAATAVPVPDIGYSLDYDFFQPSKEVGGYQAVVCHYRPAGNCYWWLEYGPSRFYLYTFSGGHWANRWQCGAPSDKWLHLRVDNSPTMVRITVSAATGKTIAVSPPIPHDDGSPAPIAFSASGDDHGNWGMKIADVRLAVTPVAERADYQQRRAALDAANAALTSPVSRRLWPTGSQTLAPARKLLGSIAATDPAAWAAYVKSSSAFDAAMKSVAAQYRANVLDKLDRKRGGWTMVDLVPSFDAEAALQNLSLPAPGPVAQVSGIPFELLSFGQNCIFQDRPSRSRRAISLKAEASSVALLLAPIYDQALYAHDDSLIDVLGIELRYADGFRERIFPTPVGWTPPLAAGIGRPPMPEGKVAAYVVRPGHLGVPLSQVVLCDDAIQAGWAILAMSYKPGWATQLPLLSGRETHTVYTDSSVTVQRKPDSVTLSNKSARLVLDAHRGLVRELSAQAAGAIVSAKNPSPLFAVEIGARLVYSDAFSVAAISTGDGVVHYRLRGPGANGPLTVDVSISLDRGKSMTWRAKMTNSSAAPVKARLIFPLLDGLDFGKRPVWWFPQRGGACSDVPFEGLSSYGGMAWLQLLDCSRASGGGLYLRCDDSTGVYKVFCFRSSPDATTKPTRVCDIPKPAHPVDPWRAKAGVHMSIEYLPVTLAPKASFSPPAATVAFHDLDWHAALTDYSRWLHTWWHQLRPCPDTYRYGFYALVGGPPADNQRNENFGSYDWWHLNPIWSIDYPDDLTSELAMLKTQAARAAKWGQQVGLYVEGFVMEKKRHIAKEHGAEWAMMDDHGKLYDYYSTKGNPVYNMCPAVPAWQKFDASAYAEIARRYKLCALYVDSIGSRWAEVCYNPAHHHPTPGIWVTGCGALLEALRQAVMKVSPNTAIHSEEPGCDYMALHEDGSWSHSLWTHISGDAEFNPAGLNYFHFVLPEFKMYEIPSYRNALWRCKLAFFNGEGLWTAQPDALRRALFIHWMPTLRENADTFQSSTISPAVPFVKPPLYANAFRRDYQTIYTIYNAGLRTRRADFAFGVVPGSHAFDLLHLREVPCKLGPTRSSLQFPVALDPHEVQCYLVTPQFIRASLTGNNLRVTLFPGRNGNRLWLALIDAEGVRHNAQSVDVGTTEKEVTFDLARRFGADARGRVLIRLAGPHSTDDETIVAWR